MNETLRIPLLTILVLGMALSATAQVDPSLVGWWRLDDNTGTTAIDSSGNGNDGEFVGNPRWVLGLIGPALHLNGDDDWVEIPHNNILTVDNEVTVAAWINADQLDDGGSGYEGIICKGNGPRSYSLYSTTNGTMHFSTAGVGSSSTGVIPLNEWTHVSAQVKDGMHYYYINGEPAGTGGSGIVLPGMTDTATVRIGNSQEADGRRYGGIIDDVRIYNRALDESEYANVMKGNPPTLAENPSPADNSDDALRDGILTWTPGMYESTHNVYFGNSYDDVNSATAPTASGLDVNSFDPGRLEFDKTYFWRVDEVNVTPDKTTYKGNVWSFTAEPYSIQIAGSDIIATASSTSNEFSQPEKTIDGSGLGEDGTHEDPTETMWFSAMGEMDPWIQYEFDAVKKLDIMKVWNSNSSAEGFIGYGVKGVEIQYSTDGETWSVFADVNEFSRAPGLPTYDQYDEIDFGGVAAKMVRLNIQSNWGGFMQAYSLSEVQFNIVPAAARTPDPASESTGVAPNAQLTWRAGREAAQSVVYVSTDANEVADGVAASATSNTNSISLGAFDVQLGETYYWRVDEVNEAEAISTWTGPEWSLTVVDAVVVDDFEGYGNDSPDRAFQAWIDGVGYSPDEFFPAGHSGNGTGSGVGHDIWTGSSPHYNGNIMETSTTLPGSGSQSLPFYYDGNGSQIDRTFAPAQDWTAGDVKTLVIWLRGSLSNPTADKLYVKINNTKVTYDGDLVTPIWQQWNIDLAASGATLSNVTTLSIGIEGNGSGLVYLDNIALYRTAPPVMGPPAGGDKSLVGHWAFDETEGLTAADSSGYGNDATLTDMTGTEWTTGTMGNALEFSGSNQVHIETSGSLQLSGSVTISAWVKMNAANDGLYMGIGGKLKTAPYQGFSLVRHSSNVFRLWADNGAGDIAGFDASSDATYTDTEWHHVAGVVDDGTSSLYVDGVKQTKEGSVNLTDTGQHAHIGIQYSQYNDRFWTGMIDDVRIYYRALSAQEISGL